MHALDWALVAACLLLIAGIGIYTQRYMCSVSDFLSGGRLAGRYLLSIASGEMEAGAVCFVAWFEVMRQSGFTLGWWQTINVPVLLVIGITGFVAYRYRETRVMTLAQLFEVRYSKAFRIFTGMLGFLAGLVNFGIIPAIGARFLVYFLGVPASFPCPGLGFEVPSYIPLMGLLLGITTFLTLSGGSITLLVTNCVEGMITQLLYLVLIFGLIAMFKWDDIVFALTHVATAQGIAERAAGHSLVNPFDSLNLKDFNIWFVLMGLCLSVYGTLAWQNQSTYKAAALNAHEARMGGILGRWRGLGKGPVLILLGACAMTYLIHPHYAAGAEAVRAEIAKIPQPQIQQQMELPIAVAAMLPVGMKGALCVILLLGIFGGDGSHLHSWSSLFIQDVLVPLRKKPLTPREHIRWLRRSVVGVALFAFLFGCLFRQTEYIVMWWTVTMALYLGGAGAVIIGGLYWKKGTTAAAWTAMLTGSGLSTAGIVARQIWGNDFPLNGVQISFGAALVAIPLYIAVSLLTCREDFDMDRMLHRGKYAKGDEAARSGKKIFSWGSLIGFDADYTRRDRWVAGTLLGWSLLCLAVFLGVTLWNGFSPWTIPAWSRYWYVTSILIPIGFALVGTVWFTWGGLRDMARLFRLLREKRGNALDNGMVVDHQNLDDARGSGQTEAAPVPAPGDKIAAA